MKASSFLPLVLSAALLLSGCTLTEKYSKNNAAAAAWISANARRPAATNFEGVYYSPDWGIVALNQRDGKLTGSIAHFHITGIVSGKSAYALLVDDEWVEHTMILTRKSSEIVEGSYSSFVPYSKVDSLPVHLDRIVD